MTRIKAILITTIFFVLIGSAYIVWPIAKNFVDTENHEKRELASKPALTWTGLRDFPQDYENYVNDNLPFRNQLIKTEKHVESATVSLQSTEKVLVGKDGWLYYIDSADGDPVASYKGRDVLTEEQLAGIKSNVEETAKNMKAEGRTFVIMIVPNKERMYPEYLPDSAGDPAEIYAAKQIYDYLKANTDVHIVYPYDALMQMARWFGYRPGYEDLCRIWMSEKAAGWYKFVADSTADLFDELRNMRQVQRTPKNYGLRIRQSPDSLIVTARNKMGTGTKLAAPIDLNNGFVETIAFDRRSEAIQENKGAVNQLLSSISSYRVVDNGVFYRHVPPSFITEFIGLYVNEDARSPKSQSKPVLNYIDDRMLDGELGEWDVLVAEGDGGEVHLSPDVIVKQEIRYPGSDTSADCLVVGEKHRLASRGVEKKGLDPEEMQAAEADFHNDHDDKANPSDRYYRRRRTYPLLIIHPVLMKYTERQVSRRIEKGVDKPEAGSWPSWDHEEEAFGWSISFPYTEKQTKPVEYVFNQVAIDNITADYEEDSDDDFEDD